MRRSLVLAVLGLAPATACGSARIAGGAAVSSDDAPPGVVVATWGISDCRDAAGAPFAESGVVELVEQSDRRVVLVDAETGYDTLIVKNQFLDKGFRVFQVALKSGASAPYLREYRVPVRGPGPGRFVVAGKHWDSRGSADDFVAWYEKPTIACTLSPVIGATASAPVHWQGPHTE